MTDRAVPGTARNSGANDKGIAAQLITSGHVTSTSQAVTVTRHAEERTVHLTLGELPGD